MCKDNSILRREVNDAQVLIFQSGASVDGTHVKKYTQQQIIGSNSSKFLFHIVTIPAILVDWIEHLLREVITIRRLQPVSDVYHQSAA